MARRKASGGRGSSRGSSTTTSPATVKKSAEEATARLIGHWFLGAVVFVAGLGAHALWGGRPVATPFVALGLFVGFSALAVHGWLVSLRAGREGLIRAHAAGTIAGVGVLVVTTLIVGPHPGWLQAEGVLLLFGVVSWNIRRFDAFRSETTERSEEDGLQKALGMAKTRVGKARDEGARLHIPLTHTGGETPAAAQSAIRGIEAAAGAVPGRSRVVPDPERADRSELVLTMADVLKEIIHWPGPSHAGMSISEAIEFGRYEDDHPAQLWLSADKAAGRPPTHLLLMGMTRSGKTNCGLVIAATILTRRDVCLLWADTVKGEQTASPIRRGLTLYADDEGKARALLRALKRVVQARADALGRAGFTDWVPACYDHPDLLMPLIVVHLEEADQIIQNDDFTYLTSKALSAGVVLIVSLQRASHSQMPTDGRSNLGGSLCFGVRDDASEQMALSESTIAAGARPSAWQNRKQGYCYAELPGVDDIRFPVPLRAYYGRPDILAQIVDAHAPIRATMDRTSIDAFGETWAQLQPGDAVAKPAGAAMSTRPSYADDAADDDAYDLRAAHETVLVQMAEAETEIADRFPDDDEADGLTPIRVSGDQPIPPYDGPDEPIRYDKPAPGSPEEAERAFDQLLLEIARTGQQTVTVRELNQRYPYRSRPWLSRRLSAVCDGALLEAYGLVLERDTSRPGLYEVQYDPQTVGAPA